MTDRYLVTHGLAVRKLATPEQVAQLLGAETGEITAALEALAADGQAVNARGRFMLTPDAQKTLQASYADRFAKLRQDDAFVSAYDRFELVNKEVKALITDWQTMDVAGERVPNDHSNAEWDTQCIDRLGSLHERAEVILFDLAKAEPRMGVYARRLEAALDQLDGGDKDYFSAAKKDSYHTVWFELHEDLLRMLGRERDE